MTPNRTADRNHSDDRAINRCAKAELPALRRKMVPVMLPDELARRAIVHRLQLDHGVITRCTSTPNVTDIRPVTPGCKLDFTAIATPRLASLMTTPSVVGMGATPIT